MSYTPMRPEGQPAEDPVEEMQNHAQRTVAESTEWLIARKGFGGGDTRLILKRYGFKILGEQGLFYRVDPPTGWRKTTNGLWTNVVDAQGVTRFDQYYKNTGTEENARLRFMGVPSAELTDETFLGELLAKIQNGRRKLLQSLGTFRG